MNDYWNDPPDYPESPECCEEEMEVNDDGDCKCLKCGAVIEVQWDIEPPSEPSELWPPENEAPPESEKCPHGNDWGDCGACDHLSDIAYDSYREDRFFRR